MTNEPLTSPREIETTLGLTPHRPARRWFRRFLWVVFFILLGGLIYIWYKNAADDDRLIRYQTASVTVGNLSVEVTATGTVQPTTQTDVSSEMSGIVRSVHVDFNSVVKKGDVLATLDTERFEAQKQSLVAGLVASEARLADAQATVIATDQALLRQQNLQKRNVGVVQQFETAVAARDRARAAFDSAKADIAMARANLKLKELDIAKSRILSPIDGIVLKRALEPGQTVASSLQAPVLFTLAEDLTHMQLEANIDEADIGAVKVGQKARFTVDAFPGRQFPAHIETIQFSPQTTDGVVTYKAILAVQNQDLSLRPGLTATAYILTNHVENATLIPNAALRYVPQAPPKTEGFSLSRLFMPRLPRPEKRRLPPTTAADGSRIVWQLAGETAKPVALHTGLTDGKMTLQTKGDLVAGDQVITGQAKAAP